MIAISIDPSKRWLRMHLTVLYAGLFLVLVAAVLAVSGVLFREGSTNINGGSSSHNAVFDHHLQFGAAGIVAVVAELVAAGLAWWIAGRVLRRSTPSASE